MGKILLDNVIKSFGNNEILKGINLEFDEKKCYLITGKNGSGKTTLLKIIFGLIRDYSGRVGKDNNYLLLDDVSFFPDKSGRENLCYFLEKVELEKAKEIISYFELESFLDMKVKNYSSGIKKKIGLVLAFSKKVDTVMLDEPSNSLDYQSIILLKKLIKKEKKNKRIVISSHDSLLRDSNIIDYIYYINEGKIKFISKIVDDDKIYKVQTRTNIVGNFNILYCKDDYSYIQIKNFEKDILNLIPFGLQELIKVDSFDEYYLKEVIK